MPCNHLKLILFETELNPKSVLLFMISVNSFLNSQRDSEYRQSSQILLLPVFFLKKICLWMVSHHLISSLSHVLFVNTQCGVQGRWQAFRLRLTCSDHKKNSSCTKQSLCQATFEHSPSSQKPYEEGRYYHRLHYTNEETEAQKR